MENRNCKIGIYDSCYNSQVFDAVPEGSRCLDVGCWTGNLGKALIENKSCTVDGIDCNKAALDVAKDVGYENTFNIDLNAELKSLNISNKYDCVICADVLEHLKDPNKVLGILKDRLEKKGTLIVSVPNVAFIQQRVFLLFGKFDYNPNGGLMDSTHLKFFTKKGISTLLEEAGFKVQRIYGYSLVKNKYFFLRVLARFWPELFALQFLVEAKKK